jgi:hypothetical protein
MELGLRVSVGFRGRTIWIADAHRGDGTRFVVRAEEKLTASLKLEWRVDSLLPIYTHYCVIVVI